MMMMVMIMIIIMDLFLLRLNTFKVPKTVKVQFENMSQPFLYCSAFSRFFTYTSFFTFLLFTFHCLLKAKSISLRKKV